MFYKTYCNNRYYQLERIKQIRKNVEKKNAYNRKEQKLSQN